MNTKYLIYSAALLTGSLAAAHAQSDPVIAQWSFSSAVTAPYNSPAPTVGAGTATPLGMLNNYTFNGGEGPGSAGPTCDVTAASGDSLGTGFGWRVRGPSNSSGGGAGQANGWNSQAPIGTQGAEFAVDTTLYTSLNLSFDINDTAQGEGNLAVEYTLNDTVGSPTWFNATITSAGSQGTNEVNTTSANTIMGNYVRLSSGGTGWNNQITATFGAGAAEDPNFAFEIVNASTGADCVNSAGAALNNSSGNWRYDNVILTGVAVPEPGTLTLAGLGGLTSLLVLRRFRAA
jgi:hypothetical protein